MQETGPLLELQGVRKVFPKAAGELVVLDDINLSVRSGEIETACWGAPVPASRRRCAASPG